MNPTGLNPVVLTHDFVLQFFFCCGGPVTTMPTLFFLPWATSCGTEDVVIFTPGRTGPCFLPNASLYPQHFGFLCELGNFLLVYEPNHAVSRAGSKTTLSMQKDGRVHAAREIYCLRGV